MDGTWMRRYTGPTMSRLICRTRPLAGRAFPVMKDLMTIGTLASCDVQVLDNRAGPVHCQIRRTGAMISVADLGAPGGTLVNGEAVTDRLLQYGDRLRIGDTEFLFEGDTGERGLSDLVPGYEVMDKLGEGGMGFVFRARHLADDRLVALKVLAPRFIARPRHVEQFHREAEIARSANHPNVVAVTDVGAAGNVHYFAMELLDGETCLRRLDRDGRFPVEDVVRIGRSTARALHHLHQQRLLHRDIKPDNLMLCRDGTLRVTDLGIAADLDRLATEGNRGRIVGTPHYLAPEVAAGGEPDGRADLYSLGCTLFHLLTGNTPFRDGTPAEIITAHVRDPIPAVDDQCPEVPRSLAAVIERLMAKRREDRFADAGHVVELFAALEEGQTVDPFAGLGQDDPPTCATFRKDRRAGHPSATGQRRLGWVVAAIAVLTAVAVIGWMVVKRTGN